MKKSLKRGLIWGSIFSILLIGLRTLLNYLVVNYHPYFTQPKGTIDVGNLVNVIEKFSYPPLWGKIIIGSVIIGFLLGILLNWGGKE
jgi:hypothetical protein